MNPFESESLAVLGARLADVEGEIADMESHHVMCRDLEFLSRLYVQRSTIKRAMNGRAA